MKSMIKLGLGLLASLAALPSFAADPVPDRRHTIADTAPALFNGSVVLGGDVIYSLNKDGVIFAENTKTGEVRHLRNSSGMQSLAWVNDALFAMKKGGSVWLWAPKPLRGDTQSDSWVRVTGKDQTVRAIYAFEAMLVGVEHYGNVVRYEGKPHEEKYSLNRISRRDSKGRIIGSYLDYTDSKGKSLAMGGSYLKNVVNFEPFVNGQGKRDAKITFKDGTSNLLVEGINESRKLENFTAQGAGAKPATNGVYLVFSRDRSYELSRFDFLKIQGPYEAAIWYSLRSWGRSTSPTLNVSAEKVRAFVGFHGPSKGWSRDTIRAFFREVVVGAPTKDADWYLVDVK